MNMMTRLPTVRSESEVGELWNSVEGIEEHIRKIKKPLISICDEIGNCAMKLREFAEEHEEHAAIIMPVISDLEDLIRPRRG